MRRNKPRKAKIRRGKKVLHAIKTIAAAMRRRRR